MFLTIRERGHIFVIFSCILMLTASRKCLRGLKATTFFYQPHSHFDAS